MSQQLSLLHFGKRNVVWGFALPGVAREQGGYLQEQSPGVGGQPTDGEMQSLNIWGS